MIVIIYCFLNIKFSMFLLECFTVQILGKFLFQTNSYLSWFLLIIININCNTAWTKSDLKSFLRRGQSTWMTLRPWSWANKRKELHLHPDLQSSARAPAVDRNFVQLVGWLKPPYLNIFCFVSTKIFFSLKFIFSINL